nr:abhydrolase domain containing 3 [Hymenolepis microstoma]
MQLSWSNAEGVSDDTPIVVLLPGLTGCGCCSYITSLVREINNLNYRCVVANNRGTCRHKLKTPKTYCAAHTSDVAIVFELIRNRFPDAPMVAVGISLGALLVFNYLADEQKDASKPCPLTAAMCICMPWDVSQTSDKLEKSLDWLLFNYPLTYGLHQLVIRNAEVLSQKYDVPRILKSRSVREFDESLTVDMFGYKSVEEYYADASPASKIHRVRIPVLCLNAADDPFVPFQSLPLNMVNDSDNKVILALTRHGGHIGFLAGFLPTRPSLMDRAVPQFASAVFEHKDEFDQFTHTNKMISVDEASNDEEGGGIKEATKFY